MTMLFLPVRHKNVMVNEELLKMLDLHYHVLGKALRYYVTYVLSQ